MSDQSSSEMQAKETYARYILDTQGYAAYNLICRGDEEERPDTSGEEKRK